MNETEFKSFLDVFIPEWEPAGVTNEIDAFQMMRNIFSRATMFGGVPQKKNGFTVKLSKMSKNSVRMVINDEIFTVSYKNGVIEFFPCFERVTFSVEQKRIYPTKEAISDGDDYLENVFSCLNVDEEKFIYAYLNSPTQLGLNQLFKGTPYSVVAEENLSSNSTYRKIMTIKHELFGGVNIFLYDKSSLTSLPFTSLFHIRTVSFPEKSEAVSIYRKCELRKSLD